MPTKPHYFVKVDMKDCFAKFYNQVDADKQATEWAREYPDNKVAVYVSMYELQVVK